MRTTHDAVIHAPAEAIFALAADVERWPELHPAYRWCRVLERTPDTVIFEMGGRIRGWPARWRARQERFPAEGRIQFHHLAGLTRGMMVQWYLVPDGAGTRVELEHRGFERLGERGEVARASYDGGWPTVLGRFVEQAGSR